MAGKTVGRGRRYESKTGRKRQNDDGREGETERRDRGEREGEGIEKRKICKHTTPVTCGAGGVTTLSSCRPSAAVGKRQEATARCLVRRCPLRIFPRGPEPATGSATARPQLRQPRAVHVISHSSSAQVTFRERYPSVDTSSVIVK